MHLQSETSSEPDAEMLLAGQLFTLPLAQYVFGKHSSHLVCPLPTAYLYPGRHLQFDTDDAPASEVMFVGHCTVVALAVPPGQ